MLIVLLNAEWDHPDVFADEAAVLDAFEQWIAARVPTATIVANVRERRRGEDRRRACGEGWHGRVSELSLNLVDWRNRPAGLGQRCERDDGCRGYGGALLGVDDSTIRDSLANYRGRRAADGGQGRGRRRGRDRRLRPPPDGHREDPRGGARALPGPTGVGGVRAADLPPHGDDAAAIRRRCWPRPTRSRSPTSGRDAIRTRRSPAPAELAAAVRAAGGPLAEAPGSVEQTADYLAERVKPGDVVLVMGGGRSYVIADRLVELLRRAMRRSRRLISSGDVAVRSDMGLFDRDRANSESLRRATA